MNELSSTLKFVVHDIDEYCKLTTVPGTVRGKKKNLCINEIYVAHVRIQKRVLIIIYTCQCVYLVKVNCQE